MPSTRIIYIAFWTFIVGMLVWQFVSYNHRLDQKIAATPPRPDHFFYNAQTMAPPPPPKPDAADVRQVAFTVESEKPGPGSFICHVTLKNLGNLKATEVQVLVAPFRGVSVGNPDGGRSDVHTLKVSDSASQISQSITFPDLDPGQSVTKDAIFSDNSSYSPGNNPSPEIHFKSEPSKASNATPVAPPKP